jgi:N-acetyl sugar amidotransferase
MRYCKKCVQPDTRPSIVFDDEGVCMACRYSEEIPSIDWDERQRQLQKIVEWAKENSHGGFDCIVGVSGGKDSHFQALYVKERLGLKALLVNLAPDVITEVGRHNLDNLIQQGFDLISFRLDPKVWRAVTRRAFSEYGNPVKPSEYPLFAVSYQTVLGFGIPLVVQGENPAMTLGVLGDLDASDDALNVNQFHTLAGGNASDWVQEGIELKDLLFYQFPDKDELEEKVRAIFLSYYAKEWSFTGNTEFAVARGLRGRPGHDPNLTGRLNPYCSIDSDMQIVNQMLKYYKLGFGFVTDEVCYDLREGRLSREEAIRLVEQYDGKCDERYIHEFCEYIDISAKEFWQVVDRFVNKKLFRKDPATREWKPLFKVGYGLVSS